MENQGVISGGVLILGQDVDRFLINSSLPIKDQFGFEMMQGFSGAMSHLNIWSRVLTADEVAKLTNCTGKFAQDVLI